MKCQSVMDGQEMRIKVLRVPAERTWFVIIILLQMPHCFLGLAAMQRDLAVQYPHVSGRGPARSASAIACSAASRSPLIAALRALSRVSARCFWLALLFHQAKKAVTNSNNRSSSALTAIHCIRRRASMARAYAAARSHSD
jgi:hypothetical protein